MPICSAPSIGPVTAQPDGHCFPSEGINGETEALFQFLCSQITGADSLSYTVNASCKSPTPGGMSQAIQLGSPFYITITGDAKLGGFWNFNLVHIRIVSKGAGVSEHYWK